MKRGTFDLTSTYIKLLIALYLFWLLVSLFTKKFQFSYYKSYSGAIFLFLRSAVYTAYCASLMFVVMGLPAFSRLHFFGTFILLLFLESAIFSIYYLSVGQMTKRQRLEIGLKIEDEKVRRLEGEKDKVQRAEIGIQRVSSFLLLSDFFLVGISFFIVNYLKRGTFNPLPGYENLLLIIYGLWFVFSMMTKKYIGQPLQNYYHAIWPWIKAGIMMFGSIAVIVFALNLFHLSRIQAFGSIFLLMIFEIFFYRVFFMLVRNGDLFGDVESIEQVKAILKQNELPLEVDLEGLRRSMFEPVRKGLQEKYLKSDPGLFDLIDQSVNLAEIVRAEMAICNNNDMFYPEKMYDQPVQLFINLYRINDIRWINQYFLEVHNMLMNGGYFVGRAHTIITHKNWIFKKYPKQIANCIYVIDFLVNRILPKLPWIKRVYFAFTKGKDRIISKAEILGRLCFCGFEIIAEKEIDEKSCFVAKKMKTPSLDHSPSYGPLVEFKRIGTNNGVVRTYKFRTMHPYSEYLQDYIYKKHGLRKGGKIEDDFRVTKWGKFMRKFWLDELPMIYNWIKGDLQLFGVRPLSTQYLSLYDKDLQEMREKLKPGLIPPFYADLPVTFEEICESERRYIRAYLRNPVRTQWGYFWKAFGNIVFRGARSG